MFVRFRHLGQRLQASLMETKRANGKVLYEYIASLGTVDSPPSIRGRWAFWAALHERLPKLDSRINVDTQAKIYAAVHARIPIVTPEEQRALQLETTKVDERLLVLIETTGTMPLS
jgi:hypothetical protein